MPAIAAAPKPDVACGIAEGAEVTTTHIEAGLMHEELQRLGGGSGQTTFTRHTAK